MDVLNSIRAPGQSYDGIVQELMAFWNKNTKKEKREPLSKSKNVAGASYSKVLIIMTFDEQVALVKFQKDNILRETTQ